MDLISDIVNNPNKLSNNFNSDNGGSSSSSIVTIKCTKNLFSKEGLKNNISSYILIIFIFTFLLCLVLFLKCGYPLLNNDINDIIIIFKLVKIIDEINCAFFRRKMSLSFFIYFFIFWLINH